MYKGIYVTSVYINISKGKMPQEEKIVHGDVFSTCPKCSEWRMRVRVTSKWDELEVECFELEIDLRCLNCGFHKHLWANDVVDVEGIFDLCGSDPHYIADVLVDRMRNEERRKKTLNHKK